MTNSPQTLCFYTARVVYILGPTRRVNISHSDERVECPDPNFLVEGAKKTKLKRWGV